MDAKYVNPFIQSFTTVMPQLGFSKIEKSKLSVKSKDFSSPGVAIIIGVVGDLKGNVVYCTNIESAKKIASKMMMGMPVDELNDMAQSALSEMGNMISANSGIHFNSEGININISTPTLIYGENTSIKMSSNSVLSIEFIVDDIPIEVNLSFENQ